MSLVLRIFIALIALVLVAASAAWLAETPGHVSIDWRGYRIETSVAALAVMLALILAAGMGAYRLWSALRRLPARVAANRAARRREQGYLALTRGMVAIAAGDTEDAKRQARIANEILGRPPGALLIGAQAAQIEHKPDVARRFYEAMLEQEETELLGLRGLLTLAEQSGDTTAALGLAERARKLSPRTPWVLQRLFHLQVREKRWEEAEKTLASALTAGAIDGERGRQHQSALLVQLSLTASRAKDGRSALDRARRAVRQAPEFVPATLQLVSLLRADGKGRHARHAIEEAWARAPHPELARQYRELIDDTDPIRGLKSMATLERLAPEHPATQRALARAALDAKMWGEARRHMEAATEGVPDAATCRFHAELEQSENDDDAAARKWLARAAEAPPAPAWLCGACGASAADWSVLCGNCGSFDSLSWGAPPRVMPLAGPAGGRDETESRDGGEVPRLAHAAKPPAAS